MQHLVSTTHSSWIKTRMKWARMDSAQAACSSSVKLDILWTRSDAATNAWAAASRKKKKKAPTSKVLTQTGLKTPTVHFSCVIAVLQPSWEEAHFGRLQMSQGSNMSSILTSVRVCDGRVRRREDNRQRGTFQRKRRRSLYLRAQYWVKQLRRGRERGWLLDLRRK